MQCLLLSQICNNIIYHLLEQQQQKAQNHNNFIINLLYLQSYTSHQRLPNYTKHRIYRLRKQCLHFQHRYYQREQLINHIIWLLFKEI